MRVLSPLALKSCGGSHFVLIVNKMRGFYFDPFLFVAISQFRFPRECAPKFECFGSNNKACLQIRYHVSILNYTRRFGAIFRCACWVQSQGVVSEVLH